MLQLERVHNPYDFANPVSDADLFIGRKDELEEIRYYLDHASATAKPINLAVIGQRASGKTSLLNIIEIEATERNLIPVRIDLDQDDAKTQLGFFFKVFDSLLSAACENGAYEGPNAQTYDTYLDMVNGYAIPDDKTFCPFLFPIQYAKAMSNNNFDIQFTDNGLKSDLAKLYQAVGRPIVLIFDECNVLSGNSPVLQKLRNIFMNLPGYMLVFAGTPDLFPVMNDVFSPIIRQFKKIQIDRFKDKHETRECIERPLAKIGIDLEDIFDAETFREVSEIHDLSNGRPYEVQLICHMLFKRVQTRRAKVMKLDLSLLEDVRRELESTQDINSRPILRKIKKFNQDEFAALNLLCACDQLATFEQIWTIEYLVAGERNWTKAGLKSRLDRLVELDVVAVEDGIISFKGDDFDKIYTKYYAREQGVNVQFPDLHPCVFWQIRLEVIFRDVPGVDVAPLILTTSKRVFEPIEDITSFAASLADDADSSDLFSRDFPAAEYLYSIFFENQHRMHIPLLQVQLSTEWISVQTWVQIESGADSDLHVASGKLIPIRTRCEELGTSLLIQEIQLEVLQRDTLMKKVTGSSNEVSKQKMCSFHLGRMVEQYLDKSNVSFARDHAKFALLYGDSIAAREFNNIGYIYLAGGQYDDSLVNLERAIAVSREDGNEFVEFLARYNSCVVQYKRGRRGEAAEALRVLCELVGKKPKIAKKQVIVFVISEMGGLLTVKENRNIDLATAIEQSLRALEQAS